MTLSLILKKSFACILLPLSTASTVWEIWWWVGRVDHRGRAVSGSVRVGRTIREVVADGPRRQCSSRVLRVLARLRFWSVVFSSFGWARFRTVRVCWADSPCAPYGRSVFWGSLLVVLLALTGSPRPRPDGPPYLCGQSAVHWRTVRVARADSAPLLAGRFARAWLFCSLVRFLPSFFRASACASRNHS
jgi:hypothetical protein